MKATAGQRVRFNIPLSVARVCGHLSHAYMGICSRVGILCHLFTRRGSGVSVRACIDWGIFGYLFARVLIGTNRVQGLRGHLSRVC